VKLKGWFAPQIAAVISRRREAYFLSPGSKKVLVNGQALGGRHDLKEGDLIVMARVQLQFNLVAW
jgi:hypothetical protein